MASRRPVPLALMAVLIVLTLGFAVLALTMSPNSANLTVQNGTAETFSASQFSIQLTETITIAGGAQNGQGGAQSEVRVIDFTAPDRLVVVRVSPKLRRSFHGQIVRTTILQYAALTSGGPDWIRQGSHFVRTQSLQSFAAGQGQKTSASGAVTEAAVVRNGYLVATDFTLHVKSQTANGQTAPGGTSHETLHLLRVNGGQAPAVNS
jgi:hypothetical protein